MKTCHSYVLLQEHNGFEVLDSAPPYSLGGETWVLDDSSSLGGCFYDYLRDAIGEIAGIRYWIGSQGTSVHDSVFRNFLKDKRFVFSKDNIFVDILFDHRAIELFKNGELIGDDAQDFGGEFVVKSNKGATGIGFNYEID